jgi:hypothetical protein
MPCLILEGIDHVTVLIVTEQILEVRQTIFSFRSRRRFDTGYIVTLGLESQNLRIWKNAVRCSITGKCVRQVQVHIEFRPMALGPWVRPGQ